MADVFLAKADIAGRVQPVALKRIRASMADCAEAWPMFQREAELCKLLQHPSIVQLKAVGDDAVGPYLALEYVSGATAAELLRSCSRRGDLVQLTHALCICRDIADAVAYAHALEHDLGRGLVHRDISPENVLIGFDGRAKVTDFGISCLVGHTRFTKNGGVRGKVGYIAPELVDGGPPSLASDVFALAVTVYKVLSGAAPFAGTNDGEILRNLMFGTPPPLLSLRPDVPEPIADWVGRALLRDPSQRPTAAELYALIPAYGELERKELGRWLTSVFPPRVYGPEAPIGAGVMAKLLKEVPTVPPEPPAANEGGPTVVVSPELIEPRPSAPTLPPLPAPAVPRQVWVAGALALVSLTVISGAFVAMAVASKRAPVVATRAAAAARSPVAELAPPQELPAAPELEAAEPIAEDEQPAAAARRAKRGSVDVRVTPFADVFVDGRLIGTTPLKPIELTAGPHQLLLVNSQLDVHRTVSVTVEAGHKLRVTEQLSQ